MHNLTKISVVGVELFHTDGRTDGHHMTRLLVTGDNPAKSHKEVFGGLCRGIVDPSWQYWRTFVMRLVVLYRKGNYGEQMRDKTDTAPTSCYTVAVLTAVPFVTSVRTVRSRVAVPVLRDADTRRVAAELSHFTHVASGPRASG